MKYIFGIDHTGFFIDYCVWEPVLGVKCSLYDERNTGKDIMELLLNATEVFLDGD